MQMTESLSWLWRNNIMGSLWSAHCCAKTKENSCEQDNISTAEKSEESSLLPVGQQRGGNTVKERREEPACTHAQETSGENDCSENSNDTAELSALRWDLYYLLISKYTISISKVKDEINY